MTIPLDVRKLGIGIPLALGVLMLLVFFAGGGFTVLGSGIVLFLVAGCVFFGLQPGQILLVLGTAVAVLGLSFSFTYEETTTYSFDGTPPETSIEPTGLAVGIPLIVVGLVLLGGGYALGRLGIRWPTAMGAHLQQMLDSRVRPADVQTVPVGDVVGVVSAPVPPEQLHAAAIDAAASLSAEEIVLLEERPGLIRIGRGRPGMTPDFAVHVEVTALPSGSRARVVVALTQPSPNPGEGVLAGRELDALLARLRSALGAVSPAAQWE